jgi:ribonuclease T2
MVSRTCSKNPRPQLNIANPRSSHTQRPNYCDRGFPESCDPSRAYDVRSTLEAFGAHDLIEYMQTYWQPDNSHEDSFWNHEWSKHGTCVSTMEPECYGDDYRRGEEVPVYFRRTIELFQGLNTYQVRRL